MIEYHIKFKQTDMLSLDPVVTRFFSLTSWA